MELFFRFVCGNQVFDALDPQLRSRVLADGEVFFTVELPAQAEYLPDPGELAQVDVPCVVTAGVDSRDPTSPVHYHFEASSWLADQLGTSLVEVPGAHVPHLTHPQEFVKAVRPILERMWPTT
jgi:pimeloyl-ACP methyl ester carboxylesterase